MPDKLKAFLESLPAEDQAEFESYFVSNDAEEIIDEMLDIVS